MFMLRFSLSCLRFWLIMVNSILMMFFYLSVLVLLSMIYVFLTVLLLMNLIKSMVINKLPKDALFVAVQNDLFGYDRVEIYRSPGGRKQYRVCFYTEFSHRYRVIYSEIVF